MRTSLGGDRLAKPEWGTKQMCRKCGARFYDLNRAPIVCPRCQAKLEAEEKKSRPSPEPVAAKPPKKIKSKKAEPVSTAEDDDIEPKKADATGDEELIEFGKAQAPEDDKEEEVLEDASELGEDEDDVAEVLEGGTVDAKPGDP